LAGCLRVGVSWSGLEVFGDNLVWRLAIQHTLSSGVVGRVEAPQQLFEGAMRVDVDVEHLADDPSVEALDHAVGLRCPRLGVPILCPECIARSGKGWREAAAVVGQHMC